MIKVTELNFLKNKLILVIFNEELKFKISEDVYIQMPLQVGSELDEEKWQNFEELITFDKCYKQSLNYISRSPHSIGLLRQKLQKKRLFSKGIIEQAIHKLENLGYINDEKFCQLFIEQQRPKFDWGEYRIRQKLTQYKIAKEIIDKYISLNYNSPDEELEKIEKSFEKKWKSFREKDSFSKKKEKTILFLQRKGFKMDAIWQIIEKKLVGENNDLSSY